VNFKRLLAELNKIIILISEILTAQERCITFFLENASFCNGDGKYVYRKTKECLCLYTVFTQIENVPPPPLHFLFMS